MAAAKWIRKVDGMGFYTGTGYYCPKCDNDLPFRNRELVKASDVMFDDCPYCGVSIVINMLHDYTNESVLLEAFADPQVAQARGRVLASKYQEMVRWKALPKWRRMFSRKPTPPAGI